MSKNVKLSVVVPVFNAAAFLPECLDSLLTQKYTDIEYILVNDGSTDASLQICERYAKKDDRFVVLSKENGGPSSARNLAISKARGEYLTFVDSDDYVANDAYEIIADLLETHSNPDCLIFGAHLIPEDAPEYMYQLVSPRDIVYDRFEPAVLFDEAGARPFLWLQVIKKSIVTENRIVMNEELRLGEDQLFQMEALPYAKKVVFVSQKLYFYRWKRVGSIMYETEGKRLKKLLLHVDLVDRVFNVMEIRERDVEMKKRTLIWSIFFVWNEIVHLSENEQNEIAAALVKVWEKHCYRALLSSLDIKSLFGLRYMILMSESDREKRAELLIKADKELAEAAAVLHKIPGYQEILHSRVEKISFWQRVKRCQKENGFFGMLKKACSKIYQKLFQ